MMVLPKVKCRCLWWWWCCHQLRLCFAIKLHFHWQRQTSSQSFACPNDNISPENLLPPPVYTAQVTIITNPLSISMDFRPRQNIWFLLENRLCWVLLKKTFKNFANCRFPTTVATVLCTLPGAIAKEKASRHLKSEKSKYWCLFKYKNLCLFFGIFSFWSQKKRHKGPFNRKLLLHFGTYRLHLLSHFLPTFIFTGSKM